MLTGPGLSGMLEGLNPCDNITSRFVQNPSIRPSVDGGGALDMWPGQRWNRGEKARENEREFEEIG